jgi:hypothetical protein
MCAEWITDAPDDEKKDPEVEEFLKKKSADADQEETLSATKLALENQLTGDAVLDKVLQEQIDKIQEKIDALA